jgi:lipoprotein-anchoring transpeptidase ErfK/SrfK
MKALMLSKLAMVAVAAMVLAVRMMAQQVASQASQQQPTVARVPKRVIVVSLQDRKLALVEDGQVKKVYSVAVGKPSTPSPVGTFTIERRATNPTYHHNGKTVLPGPGNPVGTRWMGLSIPGYGIHGTNEPKSIGKAASHGCIRMARIDLEEFYELVAVGDTVELVGERNEETARLFGDSEKPAAAAQPVLLAMATPDAAPMLVSEILDTEQAHPELVVLMASR